jgi:tetratricopeptide (TPR) repeat protein
MSTRTSPVPSLAARGLSGLVAAAVLTVAMPAAAMPLATPSPTVTAAEPAPATLEAALEAGDLATARALAREARLDDPTAATWQREGEVLEQAGDYHEAAKSYRSAKKAAGDDPEAVAAAAAGLARVKASARGTIADEPASTHREALDARWEPPAPKPVTPPPEPLAEAPPSERIVTKWYFWVTVGAIAASAVAVTAIAIKAARDDQPDALDALAPAPASRGFGALRF